MIHHLGHISLGAVWAFRWTEFSPLFFTIDRINEPFLFSTFLENTEFRKTSISYEKYSFLKLQFWAELFTSSLINLKYDALMHGVLALCSFELHFTSDGWPEKAWKYSPLFSLLYNTIHRTV